MGLMGSSKKFILAKYLTSVLAEFIQDKTTEGIYFRNG